MAYRVPQKPPHIEVTVDDIESLYASSPNVVMFPMRPGANGGALKFPDVEETGTWLNYPFKDKVIDRVQRHGYGIAIRPSSVGILVIDVDEGDFKLFVRMFPPAAIARSQSAKPHKAHLLYEADLATMQRDQQREADPDSDIPMGYGNGSFSLFNCGGQVRCARGYTAIADSAAWVEAICAISESPGRFRLLPEQFMPAEEYTPDAEPKAEAQPLEETGGVWDARGMGVNDFLLKQEGEGRIQFFYRCITSGFKKNGERFDARRDAWFEAYMQDGAVDKANQNKRRFDSHWNNARRFAVPRHKPGSLPPVGADNDAGRVEGEAHPPPAIIMPQAEFVGRFPLESALALRRVVRAVQNRTGASTEVVFTAAMGVLNSMVHGVFDVQFSGGTAPTSLYLVTGCASGRRKSSALHLLSAGIKRDLIHLGRQFEDNLIQYDYEMQKWRSECSRAAKAGDESPPQKPIRPRDPDPYMGNPTVAALKVNLFQERLAQSVVNSEGAAFLESWDNRGERASAAFSDYNSLWSGDTVKTNRIQSGVADIRGRRLSLCILSQRGDEGRFALNDAAVRRGFAARTLTARDTGTDFARGVMPQATPSTALREFHRACSWLLSQGLNEVGRRDNPEICPVDLIVEGDAAAKLQEYEEEQLDAVDAETTEYERNFRARAHEMAARVAANLAVAEYAMGKPRSIAWDGEMTPVPEGLSISAQHIAGAINIVDWFRASGAACLGETPDSNVVQAAMEVSGKLAILNDELLNGVDEENSTLPRRLYALGKLVSGVVMVSLRSFISNCSRSISGNDQLKDAVLGVLGKHEHFIADTMDFTNITGRQAINRYLRPGVFEAMPLNYDADRPLDGATLDEVEFDPAAPVMTPDEADNTDLAVLKEWLAKGGRIAVKGEE